MPDGFDALRRANPRAQTGFEDAVEAAAEAVRARLAAAPPRSAPRPRRRVAGFAIAGGSAAAGAAVILSMGSLDGGTTVESAHAALAKAATVTAGSAERSGTATLRITHDGRQWGATTVRWGEGDVSITNMDRPKRPGAELLVVDGTLYGLDERGKWLEMGDPAGIDPDSGTTPAEYLAAVREDVGGDTLRRFTGALSDLSRTARDDGSVVYSGTIAAGLLARESGFKEGQHHRVLPFGYVAHDEAADPDSRLQTTVTTGADGIVREIAARWGTWSYTVTYSELGTTPAPVAPQNATSLKEMRQR
jgi:hypothetical protein